MIIEMLDEYLETVAGYIFDDDKLVTYKWLSKELEVHVDVAKQILYQFRQKYKKEKSFDCTLLLMGILPDDGMRVEVVKENDLASAKEKYEKILSEHIYSLQKVLPNIQLLEMSENGDIKYSAIKCIENNERSNDEMHMLRWGAISNEVQPASEEKINCIPEPTKDKDKEMKEETSPKNKVADKKKVGQKKGFDNLFGKVANKQKSVSTLSDAKKADSTQTTKKGDTSKSSKKPTQGGLSNFLQQNKKEEVKNTVASETKKDSGFVLKENTEKEVIPDNNKQQNKKKQGKKRNRSKDISSIAKRKRIAVLSDSSDTDNDENEDLNSDEERRRTVESSPEHVSPVKVQTESPLRIKVENNKRKVLKTVDKTFVEGDFLVTTKAHVYESCSEDESEIVESKKSTVPEHNPKTKEKKNNKQAAITSFFKKV